MRESGDFQTSHQKERNILTGVERPRNKLEHQIILAQELFARDNPSAALNIDNDNSRNEVMNYWVGNNYAKAFSDLLTHEDFKQHYRFNKDTLNVTLSDVEYFLHNNAVPER